MKSGLLFVCLALFAAPALAAEDQAGQPSVGGVNPPADKGNLRDPLQNGGRLSVDVALRKAGDANMRYLTANSEDLEMGFYLANEGFTFYDIKYGQHKLDFPENKRVIAIGLYEDAGFTFIHLFSKANLGAYSDDTQDPEILYIKKGETYTKFSSYFQLLLDAGEAKNSYFKYQNAFGDVTIDGLKLAKGGKDQHSNAAHDKSQKKSGVAFSTCLQGTIAMVVFVAFA